MGFMWLAFWPVFLFIIPMAIISVRAVVMTVSRPRKGVSGAACGVCRYPVRGLTEWRCPECGNDLLAAGVLTPAIEVRMRGGLVGALAGWTFLCAIAGLLLSVLGTTIAMRGAIGVAGGGTTTVWPLTPGSGQYQSLTAEQTVTFTGAGTSSVVRLGLQAADGGMWWLEVVGGGAAYEIQSPEGGIVLLGVYDTQTVEKLFENAGVTVSDPTVTVEMADATRITDLLVVGSFTNLSTLSFNGLTVGQAQYVTTGGTANAAAGGGGPDFGWARRLFIAGTIGGLLVWIAGMIVIVMRRRRLMRTVGLAGRAWLAPAPVRESAQAPAPTE